MKVFSKSFYIKAKIQVRHTNLHNKAFICHKCLIFVGQLMFAKVYDATCIYQETVPMLITLLVNYRKQ